MHNYFNQYIKAVTQPLPEMINYFDKENKYLEGLVTSTSIALDVGCGNGRTMKYLAPYVKKVVGIDYDPKMTIAARKNLDGISNIKIFTDDYLEFEFEEKFDLVFASYSLIGSAETHPRDRSRLLQKMVTDVKSGGHVVASAWCASGIEFARQYYPHIGIKVTEIKGNRVVTDQGIFLRFDKGDLEDMAKGIGASCNIRKITDLFYLMDFTV